MPLIDRGTTPDPHNVVGGNGRSSIEGPPAHGARVTSAGQPRADTHDRKCVALHE